LRKLTNPRVFRGLWYPRFDSLAPERSFQRQISWEYLLAAAEGAPTGFRPALSPPFHDRVLVRLGCASLTPDVLFFLRFWPSDRRSDRGTGVHVSLLRPSLDFRFLGVGPFIRVCEIAPPRVCGSVEDKHAGTIAFSFRFLPNDSSEEAQALDGRSWKNVRSVFPLLSSVSYLLSNFGGRHVIGFCRGRPARVASPLVAVEGSTFGIGHGFIGVFRLALPLSFSFRFCFDFLLADGNLPDADLSAGNSQ